MSPARAPHVRSVPSWPQPGAALGHGLCARSRSGETSWLRARWPPSRTSTGSTSSCSSTASRGRRLSSVSMRGELRFTAGGDLVDQRGATWSVEGELAVLAQRIDDGQFRSSDYPDALARSGRRCTARRQATSSCPRLRATSSSTGVEPTTSGAAVTARCIAPTRSARCSGAAQDLTRATPASSGHSRMWRRWCGPISALVLVLARISLLLAPIWQLGSPQVMPIHSPSVQRSVNDCRAASSGRVFATVSAGHTSASSTASATPRTGCSCSGSGAVGARATSSTWWPSRSACICSRSTTGSPR